MRLDDGVGVEGWGDYVGKSESEIEKNCQQIRMLMKYNTEHTLPVCFDVRISFSLSLKHADKRFRNIDEMLKHPIQP